MAHRSAVDFCRALDLDGWDHFAEAAALGRGVVAVVAPFGLEATARRALRLYRSALDLPAESAVNPEHSAALAEGATLVTTLRATGAPAHGARALIFGVELGVSGLAGQLAARTGAPVVPLLASPEAGGIRLVAARPIAGRDGAATATEITRRIVECVETRLGHRPALFPWMEPFAVPGDAEIGDRL